MRMKTLAIGIMWLCALSYALAGSLFPPLKEMKIDPTTYRFLSDQPVSEFDLKMQITFSSSKGEVIAVVFCYRDERNFAFVGFDTSSARIGKVEEGLELELARSSLPSTTKGKSIGVLLRQRSWLIELFVDGRRCITLSPFALGLQSGHVGHIASSNYAKISNVSFQPVEDVYFADDFMRSAGEQSEWQPISGKWEVKASDNPLRSANAFTYFGRATKKDGEAISVVGYPFWDNYSFQASVRCADAGSVGLIFCWLDKSNYYLFRWTGREGKSAGKMQLLKRSMNNVKVLFESAGGFTPGEWYEVRVETALNSARVFIDGHKVCEVADEGLCRGMVGLYTTSVAGAYFDDVVVSRAKEILVDFEEERTDGILQPLTGTWRMVKLKGLDRACEAEATSEAKALLGDSRWSNYAVTALVSCEDKGDGEASFGICFNYQDEGNHYLADVTIGDKPTVEVVRYLSGERKLIASKPFKVDTKGMLTLCVSSDEGLIEVSLNGEKLIQAFDASITSGMLALYAKSSKVRFHELRVRFGVREFNKFSIAHEVFAHEYSMGNWAAAQSDWVEQETKLDGKEIKAIWHRADFWGDMEARLKANLTNGKVALILTANGYDINSGYRVEVTGEKIKLFRQGELVAEAVNEFQSASIRIRRVGSFVLVSINGKPLLAYSDEAPLTGNKFGFVSIGDAVRREDIELFTANGVVDMFKRAAVDWIPSNGLWDVSQRWQCDPRWSFFSGISWNMVHAMSEEEQAKSKAKTMCKQQGATLAVAWSKYLCDGDMTVEFAVAVKMARERGSYVSYAQDLNVTICADGEDLNSGYTFVLGGWRGKKSAIVRGTKVVAQIDHQPFGEDIHRKWFLIRVEKRGGRLRYFVDEKLLLEYEDKEPLNGKHIAIWTRDNGIMVARFTLCAEHLLGKREPTSVSKPVAKTFYDTL
jgi:hypothetical protein